MISSCSKNTDEKYTDIIGYDEYISDYNTGYSGMNYYGINSSMESSLKAIDYYRSDSRIFGDYIVTDYLNGICINKYLGNNTVVNIPTVIDGKKVIKIGSYLRNNNSNEDIDSPFAGIKNCVLNIPPTVKYIEEKSLLSFKGYVSDDIKKYSPYIVEINVDSDNPFYSCKDGVLYNKKGDTLLFVEYYQAYKKSKSIADFEYIVPEQVKHFKPLNGILCDMSRIRFNKHIKSIDTFVDYGEDGNVPIKNYNPNLVVEGYKNTIAEKWAKKWYLDFVEIR